MLALSEVLPTSAAVSATGHLCLGGCDLAQLAAEHGTPLAVFDETLLRANAREYRAGIEQWPGGGEVVYASKAYYGLGMLRLAHEEGLSVDVASGGELYAALAAGFPGDRIHLHGNNKSAHEIDEALAAGVATIILDGFDEIALVDQLAGVRGVRQRVLIRVTPGVKPSTHAYISTGQLDSKFGFSLEGGLAAQAVAAVRASANLDFDGLHCHLGSQLFDLAVYHAAAALLADFAKPLGGVQTLDMGGGLGIAYTKADTVPTITTWCEAVTEAVDTEWRRVGLPMPRLMVEPGRSMVGRAGVTLYRVGGMKDVPGVRTYVSVDGGMSDLMRPMLYGAVYEPLLANRADEEPSATVRLVGKHCESGDVLVSEAHLPPPAVGDVVCMPATGAYGVSMASNYNGVTRPAVLFVAGGTARVVTRRETYAEIVARDL